MNEENKTNEAEQIKKLLEQNLAYSKEIYTMTRKIKSYITFQKVVSVIYILLIVVPIILSIIFLPPLISNYLGQYQELLGGSQSGASTIKDLLKGASGNLNLNNVDVNKLSPQVKNLLNK